MLRGIFIHLTAAMALWHATVGCCAHHDHSALHDAGLPHSHGVVGCCGEPASDELPAVAPVAIESDARSIATGAIRRDQGDSTCQEHDCRFPAPDRSGAIELVAGRDGLILPPTLSAMPTFSTSDTYASVIVARNSDPPLRGEFAPACRLHAALRVWRL